MFTGSGRGSDKKMYVLSWLSQRGIAVVEDKINAMIESMVYEMKGGYL